MLHADFSLIVCVTETHRQKFNLTEFKIFTTSSRTLSEPVLFVFFFFNCLVPLPLFALRHQWFSPQYYEPTEKMTILLQVTMKNIVITPQIPRVCGPHFENHYPKKTRLWVLFCTQCYVPNSKLFTQSVSGEFPIIFPSLAKSHFPAALSDI